MSKQSELRQFRHAVAVLKQKGLVSKSIDARKVKPTKNLKRTIAKYDDVLSGKVTPVLKSRLKESTTELHKHGYEIARPKGLPARVLVAKDATEKVTTEAGRIKYVNPHGIDRIQLSDIPVRDAEKYFATLKARRKQIDAMKKKGEFFAFRYYGGYSQIYDDIELLLDELYWYQSVQDVINEDDPGQMMELIQNIEIVRVKKSRDWEKARDKARAEREKRRKAEREKKPSHYEPPPWKAEAHKKQEAARQRDYRAQLAGKKLKEYKEAAKARARKSRKQRRKK